MMAEEEKTKQWKKKKKRTKMNEMLRHYLEDSHRGSITDLFTISDKGNKAQSRKTSTTASSVPMYAGRRQSTAAALRRQSTVGSATHLRGKLLALGGSNTFSSPAAQSSLQSAGRARAMRHWRIGTLMVWFIVRIRREARRFAQMAAHDVRFLEGAYWQFAMENVMNCSEAVSRFLRTRCGVEIPQHEARRFLISIRHRKNEIVPFRHILLLVLELRKKQRQNRKTDVEEAFEMMQSVGGGVQQQDGGHPQGIEPSQSLRTSISVSDLPSSTLLAAAPHQVDRSAGVPLEKFQNVLAQFELGIVVPKKRNDSPPSRGAANVSSSSAAVEASSVDMLTFSEFQQLLGNGNNSQQQKAEDVCTPQVTSLPFDLDLTATPGNHHHHQQQQQHRQKPTFLATQQQQQQQGLLLAAGQSPNDMGLGSMLLENPTSAFFNPDDSDEDLPSSYLRQRVKKLINGSTKLGRVSTKAADLKRQHELEAQVKACGARHGTWGLTAAEGAIAYKPKKRSAQQQATTHFDSITHAQKSTVVHERTFYAAGPAAAGGALSPPALHGARQRPQSALAKKLFKTIPSKSVDDFAGTPVYLRHHQHASSDHTTSLLTTAAGGTGEGGDDDLHELRRYCAAHAPAHLRLPGGIDGDSRGGTTGKLVVVDDIQTQSAAQDALTALFGRHHLDVERINDSRARGTPADQSGGSLLLGSAAVAARQRPQSASFVQKQHNHRSAMSSSPLQRATMADAQPAPLPRSFHN